MILLLLLCVQDPILFKPTTFLPYTEAYAKTTTETTLVVQVSQPDCPPCARQKREIENTLFPKNVIFAYVDLTKEPKLGRKLLSGSTYTPTTVIYKFKDGKWQRNSVIKRVEMKLLKELVK